MTDYKSEREQQWRVDLRKTIPAKERTNMERVEMPMQDAVERRSNNKEVNLGLTVEMAVKESHPASIVPTRPALPAAPSMSTSQNSSRKSRLRISLARLP